MTPMTDQSVEVERSPETRGPSAWSFPLSARGRRRYIVVLCLLGAVRVFLGATSLPLFNNVDEVFHFDLVHKIARGHWPNRRLEIVDEETARIQVLYGTLEYNSPPEKFPYGVYPPPPWTIRRVADFDAIVERTIANFGEHKNFEAHSPPLYYVVAAVWYDLGKLMGLDGPYAAYWVRFLNIPLYVAIIVAAYGFCRAYFSLTVAIAVPAMIAFFPSTVFFGITSDVLSPLAALLALWLLVRWYAESNNVWLSVLAGLTVSATVLVKVSNLVILAACGFVLLCWLHRAWKGGQFKRECPKAALLLLSAVGPLAAWMLHNKLVLGDWMGAEAKIHDLDWHVKPFGQMFDHPLFSLAGQEAFWSRLFTSFYLGETYWHGTPAIMFPLSNAFFMLSFAFLPIGLGAIWIGYRRRRKVSSLLAGMLSAFAIAGSAVFLIAISLMYDFGRCCYPSPQYPYFNSGRLVYGILVPVLALYVYGVVAATGRSRWATVIVLGVSILLMVLPQIVFLAEVLPSRYNWFHMIGS